MNLSIPDNILDDISNGELSEELSFFLEEKENYLDVYDYAMITHDGRLFENLINLSLSQDHTYLITISIQDILSSFSESRKEKILFDTIPCLLEKWDEQPLPSIEEDEKNLLNIDTKLEFDIDYYENRYVIGSGGLSAPKLSDYYSILERCITDENNEILVPCHFLEKCNSLKQECLESEKYEEKIINEQEIN